MEEQIIQQNYDDILIDGYEEDSDCISIEQIDYDEQIIVEKQHLPIFISKLAKFVDGDDMGYYAVGDDAHSYCIDGEFDRSGFVNQLRQDYIIIKRPTDEAGK